MAGKRLSWLFALVDRMSGPARKMTRALDGVDKSVNRASKAVDRLERGRHFHGVRTGAAKAKRAVDELAHSTEKANRAARGGRGGHGGHGGGMMFGGWPGKVMGTYFGALMGYQMARGIATALVSPVAAFAKAGLSSAAFKEQSLLGLGTMLGSESKGASLFAEADRMAKATGTPLREMVDRYSQLTAMGFEGDRLRQVLAGVGDLAIVGGQDKASRALLAITQIKAKGRLSAEELMQQLAETGVDIDAVYKIIGRRTGLAKPDILKAMEKGQIGSDLGIEAVLEFIQHRYSGGKLGSMAAKYSKTGPGLWANLMSAPDRFLADLDKSAGYQKAKRALENLVSVLDPETEAGKRLKTKATEMFDRIFGGLLDRFQDPKAVEEWVGKLIDGFTKLIPHAERIAKTVGDLAQNLDKAVTFFDILWNKGPITTILDETAATSRMRDAAVQTGDVGYLAGRYRDLTSRPSLNGFERQELENVKARLRGMGINPTSTPFAPSHGAPTAPALGPSHKPTAMHISPGAFQFNIHGAQDPKAIGDEVEERIATVFERLGIAQGVA